MRPHAPKCPKSTKGASLLNRPKHRYTSRPPFTLPLLRYCAFESVNIDARDVSKAPSSRELRYLCKPILVFLDRAWGAVFESPAVEVAPKLVQFRVLRRFRWLVRYFEKYRLARSKIQFNGALKLQRFASILRSKRPCSLFSVLTIGNTPDSIFLAPKAGHFEYLRHLKRLQISVKWPCCLPQTATNCYTKCYTDSLRHAERPTAYLRKLLAF
jgi:hypothetical protein